MVEKAKDGAGKPSAPALDQTLVRAVARSIWKIEAREKKIDVAKRKEDWEQKRPEHLAQARKLLRQLQLEGVDLRIGA